MFKFLFIFSLIFFVHSCSSEKSKKRYTFEGEDTLLQSIEGEENASPIENKPDYKDKIYKTMKKNTWRFENCYVGNKRGRLPLVILINSHGEIKRAGVGENTVEGKVKACIVENVLKIKFPPSKDGFLYKITYVLNED